MRRIDIVCPSKGRATKVLTKNLIDQLILIVPGNEVAEYKKHNKECAVVGTPDHIKGITATRQFILERWKEDHLFMIDDDVSEVRRNFEEDPDKIRVKDKELILELIYENAETAKSLGTGLFGFSKIRNPVEYNPMKPISLTGFVNNSFMGFVKGHTLSYDLRFSEGEDHYMTCLAMYKYRFVYIDNRYSFMTVDNFNAIGGCNDYRTIETMKENTLKLRKVFGEVVQVKSSGPTKKKVHEGERSLIFPY